MKKLNFLIIVMFLFSVTFTQYPGSKSLVHTHTGRVFDKGDLEVYTNINFFTKLGEWKEGTPPPEFSPVNWWNIAGNVILSFGLFNNFDVLEKIEG